jgi:diguanylate cyclase (GGDEF)-like protein
VIAHTLLIVMLAIGTGTLFAALVPVRQLLRLVRTGPLRTSWTGLGALIVLFIASYPTFGLLRAGATLGPSDIVVSAVMTAGAVFVLIVSQLSLRTARDIARITALERDVILDPLTSIFNRRYLDVRIEEEVSRARRHGLPLSAMMIDLDHFKRINDTYGHQVGDIVLQKICALVERVSRATDTVARYGGEELFVISPEIEGPAALALAERLREAIADEELLLPDGRRVPVTASIGVASLRQDWTVVDLVHDADANLYAAKESGRNRVHPGE